LHAERYGRFRTKEFSRSYVQRSNLGRLGGRLAGDAPFLATLAVLEATVTKDVQSEEDDLFPHHDTGVPQRELAVRWHERRGQLAGLTDRYRVPRQSRGVASVVPRAPHTEHLSFGSSSATGRSHPTLVASDHTSSDALWPQDPHKIVEGDRVWRSASVSPSTSGRESPRFVMTIND
jgi:hypothetical protein